MEIAGDCGAWLLCDEVYRHLTQEDGWSESIVDLYDKGISVSSMSKVFSLAGLRLGWIATHDEDLREAVLCHRDYDLISCGMFDEALAAVALRHKDKVLARNRAVVRDNLKVLDAWIESEPRISYVKPQVRHHRAGELRLRPGSLRLLPPHVRRRRGPSSRRAPASVWRRACASAMPAMRRC